jgi:glycosyltransferase involved in cell wall biosynthesis
MLSPHALAVKSFKKQLFLKFANLKKLYKDTTFHATQSDESKDIERVINRCKDITVIPNLPRKIDSLKHKEIEKTPGALKLISLGRIAPEKGTINGISALKDIKGKVTLDLYGTIYDQEYWSKCQSIIEQLPKHISVNYKGSVDADLVIDTLQQYHFMLLPSKGENYGHSIVESFMANRPVIISKNTPWKDLENKKMGFDVDESKLSSTIQKAVDMEQEDYQKMCTAIPLAIDTILDIENTKDKYKELFTIS